MEPIAYTRGQALPGILAQRIAILDGAMGTMIQRFKLSEAQYRGERFKYFTRDVKGNNELLSLTRPDVIADIHEGYLAAGADIIETNTFGATRVAQDDYGLAPLAREMNVAAAKLARAACDKFSTPDHPRFVAGALGPTPKTASISPDVNDPGARNIDFEQLRAAYYEQTEALVRRAVEAFGRVDGLVNNAAGNFLVAAEDLTPPPPPVLKGVCACCQVEPREKVSSVPPSSPARTAACQLWNIGAWPRDHSISGSAANRQTRNAT